MKVFKNLKKWGEKTTTRLGTIGIKVVSDLQQIPDPNQVVLPKGVSKNIFLQIWHHAKEASTNKAPPPIDHKKALNLHLSRFGDGQWEKKLKKSPTLSNSVVITDYIHHMMI